ncbi:MAG: DUF3426 domain-containing protein [Oxalicibacterium faecigallinarum]|uniref:DUF3426 domain-containing protein n=2 Tax=Oxalicibacterium faecigallinarum TaxID=573741 RepID=UPI002809B425|nr:DUF3426 domain-containing protein [Oxalicibacterium faecigallinarum]MDQ7969884.1 DUF3426 domain-containing protein [Oxalicibacterium faecigallinarum]
MAGLRLPVVCLQRRIKDKSSMALATQCPHCQTTFRVVHDQLKLRAGLVRCGYCKEIFNGIEHLLPPEESGTTAPTAAIAPTPRAPLTPPQSTAASTTIDTMPDATSRVVSTSSSALSAASDTTSEEGQEAFAAATAPSPASVMPTSRLSFTIPAHFEREHPPVYHAQDEKPADPLQRMTLMDFDREQPATLDELGQDASYAAQAESSAEELDQAISDLERKPWRQTSRGDEEQDDLALDDETEQEEEPAFVRKERARKELSTRVRNTLLIACSLLTITVLLQAGYSFRNQLAGMFPAAKPALISLCEGLGCRIALPADISSVSVESSELQTQAGNSNSFVLTALLRNDSSLDQEWPLIELTLNDANEKAVLRRVFTPLEYLRDQALVDAGFLHNSERSARVLFELNDTRASGYRVYLFYP